MIDLLPNLPACLKTRPAWVCWRSELRNSKPTKVPYNPTTERRAKSNDPSTWTDFATACLQVRHFDGLGIMFDNGLCGVDLDDCRDPRTGGVEPWAQEIVELLASYSEASPSGTGIHVLLWAELPPGGRRKGDIEMYGPGSPRYFTVTGQHLAGTPASIEHRQEQLEALHQRVFGRKAAAVPAPQRNLTGTTDLTDVELLGKARAAKNGRDFSRLWEGAFPEDDSAGDLSLCNYLAFWTGGDPTRVDSLFRQSGRMRAKWDEMRGDSTYGERTIRKALEQATEFYATGSMCTANQPRAKDGGGGRVEGERAIAAANVATAILETEAFAVDDGLSLYVYDSGYYQPKGERRIKALVKRLMRDWGLSEKWSTRRQDEVVEYIRVDAPHLVTVPSMKVINCTNGLLDLHTGELSPHSPEHLSPVQIPVAYDPEASCPAWIRFVHQTFPEDTQDLPWELAAWLMTPDTSVQKAVLLLGEGANGKSTFLTGLTAFVGHQNCANVSLHKLEVDRFAAASLVGKVANICPDLPSAHLAGTSMFKAITGGDPIYGERKYGEGFSFIPYSRLVFSANHPPQSPDASHAFFRRWLCVPFTRTFDEKTARKRGELDAELADPHELSGVLNMALAALARVRTRGIAETVSMQEAWGEFRTITDPLAVWLDRDTILDPAAVTPKEHLRRAYNAFCERTGKPPAMDRQFGKALKRLRPDLQHSQRNVGDTKTWVWLGIGLRADQPENS
ncbi:MAG: phage/plasmid primase, P4 family [Armatimonadia bacterium]